MKCLSCNKDLPPIPDRTPENHRPKENDFTVCCFCGEISRFNKNMDLRGITDEESETIAMDAPEKWMMLNAISRNFILSAKKKGSPSKVLQCQSCLKVLDGQAGITGDRIPRPGDITLCAYCGTLSIFNQDMTLRVMNDDEKAGKERDNPEKWAAMIKAAQAIIARMEPNPTPPNENKN